MLKKIILLTVLLVIVSPIPAFSKDGPLEDIKRQAIKEKRPAMVYLFKKYCEYCDAMDRDVLNTKEIRSEIKRSAVFARINADKDPAAAREAGIMGYPTTLLFDESGKRIIQIPGYISRGDFKKVLRYLGGRYYKKMSLKEYLDKEK